MIFAYIIGGLFALIGLFVQNKLRSKFKKYSQVPVASGLSGREIAERMLHHYGIMDVSIVEGQGTLTDHYNPAKKVVSLSPAVYNGRSVAAAAVASHECGHAVQHATHYSMLQFRSGIVPVIQIASSMNQYLILGGLLLIGSFPQLLLLAIISMSLVTLFSLITLPVEFDASRRALAWLDSSGMAGSTSEYNGAKDALTWAAMTYVVAALSSVVMLLYLVLAYSNR